MVSLPTRIPANSRVVGYYVPPLLVPVNCYFEDNIPQVGIVKKIFDKAKYTVLPLTKQCAPQKIDKVQTYLLLVRRNSYWCTKHHHLVSGKKSETDVE